MSSSPLRVAAVQAAPTLLDRRASTETALDLIRTACENGAGLVVLPEAFVPGYPDWVWRLKPWEERAAVLQARLFDESVVVGSRTTDVLAEVARDCEAFVSVGVNERTDRSMAMFSSQLLFGPDGSLLARHRKITPVGAERLVWSLGDGSGLQVSPTTLGRIGTLTSWENYNPLARAALLAQGVDVHIAPTWDSSEVWPATLRHLAKEGRSFVVGVSSCLHASDVPASVPFRDELYGEADDDWLAFGNSAIVGPQGDVLAGPLEREEGILYADIDVPAARAARHQFDPFGHYARPDLLHIYVDTQPREPASFVGDPEVD